MKLFYLAYTCKGNTGDLLINKYQIEEYAQYGEVYVDCTGMPYEFKDVVLKSENPNVKDYVATYGTPYRGVRMFKVIRLLKKNGFTHFTKSPGPYAVIDFPIRQFFTRIMGALGYWYAKHLGLKVFVLGIDLVMPQNIFLKSLNTNYFSLYSILGIRSQNNQHQLANVLNNTIYCPDMAFLCSNTEINAGNNKRVAVSFREISDLTSLEYGLDILFEYLDSKKYQIDLIYQVREDLGLQKNLAKRYKSLKVKLCPNLIKFADMHFYSQYDYVISNRLHVLLMGAIHGAMPIAIVSKSENENKIINIFKSVFDGNFLFYFDEIGNKKVLALLSDHTLRNSMASDIQKQKSMAKEIIKEIFLP